MQNRKGNKAEVVKKSVKRKTKSSAPGRFKIINRDISWLSFNERVLQEAMDPSVPLMDRLKFLGI